MNNEEKDEQEIRQLVSTWMEATKAGDAERVLSLMTDDAVFLVAGQPPMGKNDFAAAAQAQSGEGAPGFDACNDIQEVEICGDFAFMWQKLAVVATPPGGSPIRRSGHTLTVFRKESGRWLLARDANLLVADA
ncbi:YybH family protein [Microbulbifer litoralis]|uniref:YybH family protein n=1 Tax=Microbulbifer litoralis TaxID=2933965 RepID=UPI002028016C|nr:SgcJ/EcaC family oxidoreductase [Microbulbifer sp. GX H0434]